MVKFNIMELRNIAKNNNIRNYSNKNKKELLDYLILHKAPLTKSNKSIENSFTVKELIYIAKMNNISKYSNKNKANLIGFLKNKKINFYKELYNTTKYIEAQFTIKELINIAKKNKISLYSNKNQIQLIQYLMSKEINFTHEKNKKYGFVNILE